MVGCITWLQSDKLIGVPRIDDEWNNWIGRCLERAGLDNTQMQTLEPLYTPPEGASTPFSLEKLNKLFTLDAPADAQASQPFGRDFTVKFSNQTGLQSLLFILSHQLFGTTAKDEVVWKCIQMELKSQRHRYEYYVTQLMKDKPQLLDTVINGDTKQGLAAKLYPMILLAFSSFFQVTLLICSTFESPR